MLNIVLVSVLITSLITDISKRKIYNIVTLPCILFSLLFHIFNEGLRGLAFSGVGMLTGILLLIIPFAMGGIGAGDVKLLSAIGASMGAVFVLKASVYIAIIGGIIALGILIKKSGFMQTVMSFFLAFTLFLSKSGSALSHLNSKRLSFPYGIAIVLGTLINLFEI